MAHAYYHAKSSVRAFGGAIDDYIAIHEWMDHTKEHIASAVHRLVLHNAWGIFFAERKFGHTFNRLSDGKIIALRPIIERHVEEDYGGMIPSLNDCFAQLEATPFVAKDNNLDHAQLSAEMFGGLWSDYISLHQMMNNVRDVLADQRQQIILHNAWGITLLTDIIGETITRSSDNKTIAVRPVFEQHVLTDLKHIPSLSESLAVIQTEDWMFKKARRLSLLDRVK